MSRVPTTLGGGMIAAFVATPSVLVTVSALPPISVCQSDILRLVVTSAIQFDRS